MKHHVHKSPIGDCQFPSREPQREQTNIMACPLGANSVCAEDIELKNESKEMIIMYIFSFIDDFY